MTEKDLDVAIEKCERIMEMDTRTMQNPVSENGWIFERVYELLQYLRQFQFATDTNVGGTDTISRAAVVDAIEGVDWYHQNENGEMVHGANSAEHQAWYKAEDIYAAIEALPSAQQESKYEYHYDHTDCIWFRLEARTRCPSTCAQYRDGWNDAMNYIFRDGKGYRPYRRDQKYEG